jgi:hypothetical protein
MAKQIVGFQAMMEHAATTFPGIFNGYTLTVRESHQAGKADTSGTAKAMVSYFNRMGVDFSPEAIAMERDPTDSARAMGNSRGLPVRSWMAHLSADLTGQHRWSLNSSTTSTAATFMRRAPWMRSAIWTGTQKGEPAGSSP